MSTIETTTKIETADSYDKINICSDVAKKCAAMVKDPTNGQTMEADLRNKLRNEYYDDLITSIEMLTLVAHIESGFHDILSIQKKLQTGNTKSI